MKKLIFSALSLPIIALFAFTTFKAGLPIGASIPKADLKLTDISGKEISLGEAKRENGLLVMFSCNTCPVVKSNQQRTNEISQYALENKIGVVILNSNEAARDGAESLDAMKEYASEQQYKWYYAVDKNNVLADAFDANRTPECFLFNKDGKLVYHGAIDDSPQNADNVSRKHLKLAVDEMVGGKQVSIKTTRSVGCSIKRA